MFKLPANPLKELLAYSSYQKSVYKVDSYTSEAIGLVITKMLQKYVYIIDHHIIYVNIITAFENYLPFEEQKELQELG